jgi:hypothetical protein
MVKSNARSIGLVFFSIFSGCLGLFLSFYIPAGDSFFGTIRPTATNSLTIVTGLETNAYYALRLPLFFQNLYPLNCIAVLSALLGMLFFVCKNFSLDQKGFVAIFFLIFSTFIFDGISLFSLLTAISILINLFALSLQQRNILLLISALILPVFFPVTIIIALIIDKLLRNEQRKDPFGNSLFLFIIFCFFIALALTHFPPQLHLPPFSRFVPSTGTGLGIDPLFGPSPERPSLNEVWIAGRVTYFVFFAIFLSWITSFQTSQLKKSFGFLIFTFLLFMESDLISPSIRSASPLAGLSRLIPFAKMYSINQMICIGLIIYTALIISISNSRIAALSFALPVFLYLTAPIDTFFHTLVSDKRLQISPLLNSPSLYIIKSKLPLPPLNDTDRIILTKNEIKNLWSSTNQSMLPTILDRKKQTRWSTVPRTQHGDEWISFDLIEPLRAQGIVIPLPNFIGDFPRGVQVFNGSSKDGACTKDVLLYREPWWRGAVERVNNSLFSLKQENNVELYFSEPASLSCVTIEQIGVDSHYEWSIESIELILEQSHETLVSSPMISQE